MLPIQDVFAVFLATYEREGSEISTHTKKGTNLIDAISKYNMGGGFEDLVMGRVFSQSTGFLPEHPNETQVFSLCLCFVSYLVPMQGIFLCPLGSAWRALRY